MPQYHISLDDTAIGQRLDSALSKALPDHSRVQIQGWIKDGHVSTAQGPILTSSSFKLKAPVDVIIDAPDAPSLELMPDASLTLPILFEDPHLLVINKPTGIAVHPGAGHWSGTLVHALLAHTQGTLSDGSAEGRPGIVHRLDKDTSGAMVVAKTNQAHYLLAKALQERHVKRHYWALVWGMPNPLQGTIETHIGRDTKHRQKMTVLKDGGKHAVTHYTTQKIYRINDKITLSLVQCVLDTGRTHQIRVHMTHIGHAVVGDHTYGERMMAKHLRGLPTALQILIEALPGQALHAHELLFDHPLTGQAQHFTAPAPEPLQAVLDYLQTYYS
jgi:23S rRNA pseudouridine1911/1915/1917 synthase